MPTVPAGAKEAAKNRLKRLLGMADQPKAAELPAVEPFPKPIESQSVSPVTATQRADAGRMAADVTKATKPMKMSEALGNLNVEGKGQVRVTQSDRTRVGGGNIGGAMFPGLQQVDPIYGDVDAVWGVGKKATASSLINQSNPETYWSTLLGAEDQLKSNPIVFNRLYDAFAKQAKAGNLGDDLRDRINSRLEPMFGAGTDILDPKFRRKVNTFEERAAVADLLLGKQIGGEQRGGSIIPGTEILKRETEPMLLHPAHGGDIPTFAVGPRLFQFSGDVMNRPDLHPGFPYILTGKDTGMVFQPAPGEIAMRDFTQRMQTERGRKPGYYEWTMGEKGRGLPSQRITEDYLTYLQKQGYADGGAVGGLSAIEQPQEEQPSQNEMLAMRILDMAREMGVSPEEVIMMLMEQQSAPAGGLSMAPNE
jgi:hypothetical protein